jgi:site-specific recombinase XerC
MNTSITLQEAAEAYLELLKTQGKSSRTVGTYGRDLAQVQAFFGPNRLLSNILKVHVGKFYQSTELLHKQDGTLRAAASLTKTIRVFRMFLFWAVEQGYIQALPLTKDTPMGRSTRPLLVERAEEAV